MAPRMRRFEGPGAPSTQDRAPDPAPAAPRVYRSVRGLHQQQTRFPGRRKVVKKYGRHDSTRSPRQQTLTQVGYAVAPLSDLREIGELDKEPIVDVHDHDKKVNPLNEHTAAPVSTQRRSKRRKMHQGTAEAAVQTASFETQTLTQFVSRSTGEVPYGADRKFSFDATIRDSEDEYSLISPNTKSSTSTATPHQEVLSSTPTKSATATSNTLSDQAFSTPKTARTEIPSSQPSPFTPMQLLGRYHSPLGRQRSSPLASRATGLSMPIIEPDVGPSHWDTPVYTLKSAKRTTAGLSPTRKSVIHIQSPLKTFSSQELTKRSALQGINEVSGMTALSRRLRTPDGSIKETHLSLEVPDSDEDEDELSDTYNFNQSVFLETQAIDNTSSTLSSPVSSSSSQGPGSPTPIFNRQRTRDIDPSSSQSCFYPSLNIYARSNGSISVGNARPKVQEATGNSTISTLDNISTALSNVNQLALSQPDSSHITETQQIYSQGMESQRVPLDVIRSLGPQTDRSDIIISIHPEQVRKITNGSKDHEFCSYKIPHTVSRFWIYATRPICELQYMAVVANGFRQPGEIDSNSGIGNVEFNSGRLVAKFAYKILQVYQLNNPVSLSLMRKNGWVDGPPQRYTYVPPAVVGSLLGNLRCALFGDGGGTDITARIVNHHDDTQGVRGTDEELSISQEIEAQLLSDIAETQSQRHRPAATLALLENSVSRQPPESSPTENGSRHKQSQVLNTLLSPSLPPYLDESPFGSDTQIQTRKSSGLSVAWRSQSQANAKDHPPVREVAGNTALAAIGKAEAQKPQIKDDLSLVDHGAMVPRPELDFEVLSAPTVEDKFDEKDRAKGKTCGGFTGFTRFRRSPSCPGSQQTPQLSQITLGSQTRRLQLQRPSMPASLTLSSESTQIVLPDSLYEEVRQAPPAVILDSEDSDGV